MIHLLIVFAALIAYIGGTIAAIRIWGWTAGALTWLSLTYVLRSYLLLAVMAVAFLWMRPTRKNVTVGAST